MRADWSATAPGRYIEIELREGCVYLEEGPAERNARGHEGHGGTVTLEELRQNTGWFDDYPELHVELLRNFSERYRAADATLATLCLISDDLVPLPVPCRFAVDGDVVFAALEPGSLADAATAAIGSYPTASALITGASDSGTVAWWTQLHGSIRVPGPEDHAIAKASSLLSDKYSDFDDALAVIELRIATWIHGSPPTS